MSRLTVLPVSSKSSTEKSGQFQNRESERGPKIGNVNRNTALKLVKHYLDFVLVKQKENTVKFVTRQIL